MKKQRIIRCLSALLCLCLLAGFAPAAMAYSNVSDWAKSEVAEMEALGLLPDCLLNADLSANITRGEMCKMAVEVYENLMNVEASCASGARYFTDTQEMEINFAFEQGIINGVKLADGRASYIQGMKHYCPDGITALYGHDYEPLPAFFAGADGWLSGLPGIFPKFCVDLFNLCTVQQDAPAARKLWDKMQDFIDYFITYSNNDPHWHEVFKYVLKCFGFDAGLPRMPLGDLLPEEKKKVDAMLAAMDVTIKATNLIK